MEALMFYRINNVKYGVIMEKSINIHFQYDIIQSLSIWVYTMWLIKS